MDTGGLDLSVLRFGWCGHSRSPTAHGEAHFVSGLRYIAPNNGTPKTPAQCAGEALNNNKFALGLDVAGVGAGFLPRGDLVVAGAQATISVASGINRYNQTVG